MDGTQSGVKRTSIFARAEAELLNISPENIREHGLFVAHDGKEMTLSCPDSEGYIEITDLDPLNKEDDFALNALGDFIALDIPSKSAKVLKATRRNIVFRLADSIEGTPQMRGTDEVALNRALQMLGVAYVVRSRQSYDNASGINDVVADIKRIKELKIEQE